MKTLFLTSSVNFVAHDISKKIDRAKYKKLVFINTAAEGEDGDKQWMDDDRDALVKAGFDVFDYTITNKTEKQVKHDLQDFDVIYVEGGNVFYLLEKVQQCGLIPLIREFILKDEKLYIGTSAGSAIAGLDIYPHYRIDKAEKAPHLKDYKGFGLVDFVVFPHWGSDYFKNLYLNRRLEHTYNTDNKIILLTDYQYVHVKDDWYKIVEVTKAEMENVI